MLPVIGGVIARRVLLNFRADPEIVQKLLPWPFEAEQREGSAIVGVCLIRLERLHPKGTPSWAGITSENMAHHVAVRYRTPNGLQRGVFIWRRETSQPLVALLGGRLFLGVHQPAKFYVKEADGSVSMEVRTVDGATDISFSSTVSSKWQPTRAFHTLDDASRFFQGGDFGFSCSLKGNSLEGMQLRISRWSLIPLSVQLNEAAFYFNQSVFPKGSIEFDCGMMMRSVPHEWHEIKDCPAMDRF
jgi:hypothetical protein